MTDTDSPAKVLVDTLETLIDRHGLISVLDEMAEIARGKADHIQTNWQDDNTAKSWEKASDKILSLSLALGRINRVQFSKD